MIKWKIEQAITFCDDVKDGTHDSPKHVSNGYKLLTSKHITNGVIDTKTAKTISPIDYETINKRSKVDVNDILFSMIGTIGSVCRIASEPNFAIKNMGLFKVSDEIRSKYLYYYLQSPTAKEYIASATSGSTQQYISLGSLRKFPIKYPSQQSDMQRMVEILDSLQKKITLNNRINDYLSELIEAIFVEWFVGANSRYPTKKVLMDEIAFVNAGGDKPDVWQKCQTEEFPIPIFSNGIDNEGLYGYTTTAKITKPSITVSARGTIGFTCLRHEPYYPIVRLVSATPRDYVTAEYLYLWVKRATVIGVGTTQQQLTVPMFKNYEVDVPDATSMEEFTRVTTPLFKMVDANKAENRKLSELRNALLPKLISGEVDISKVVI